MKLQIVRREVVTNKTEYTMSDDVAELVGKFNAIDFIEQGFLIAILSRYWYLRSSREGIRDDYVIDRLRTIIETLDSTDYVIKDD